MNITRMYTDDDGVSHFEPHFIELTPRDYAPPGNPLDLSQGIPAKEIVFISSRVGWVGDWHPTPRRQINVYLSGCIAITVSDGNRREFRPGDVLLSEDLTGQGHLTEVVGDEPGDLMVIALRD